MIDLKNVPKELQSAIDEKGYDKLTSVQSLVLDPSNSGKDLLVSSQTGSGKTLAYGLSISCDGLEEIIDEDNKLKALIVTPTRELALQVFNELGMAVFQDLYNNLYSDRWNGYQKGEK